MVNKVKRLISIYISLIFSTLRINLFCTQKVKLTKNHQKTKQKTMNRDTQKEIGELIGELNEKGFSKVNVSFHHDLHGSLCVADACNPDKNRIIQRRGENLTVALSKLVDHVRQGRGEPTLAEEVEKMLQADAKQSGTLAMGECICGSQRPLLVVRKAVVSIPWHSGSVGLENEDDLRAPLQPGEIAECYDCGTHIEVKP